MSPTKPFIKVLEIKYLYIPLTPSIFYFLELEVPRYGEAVVETFLPEVTEIPISL